VPLCRESSVDKTILHATREGIDEKSFCCLGALIALAGSALAQEAMKAATVTPRCAGMERQPRAAEGAQVAILVGDPTKAGEGRGPTRQAAG